MSEHLIRMPDIGEGIAEVELVAWHVKPGDTVSEDQVLADVMTDKANVEIPSPVSGRVVALGGEVGQTLPVGAPLITIDTAGPVPAEAAPVPRPAAASEAVQPPPVQESRPAPAAPAMQAAAPRPAPVVTPAQTGNAAAAERPIASPSVRARAWELGIDLAQVRPSGRAGRVVHADLETFVAAGDGARASHASAGPAAPAAARLPVTPLQGLRPSPPRRDVVEPGTADDSEAVQTLKLVGLRRKIAQRMQEAKRRIPHFSYIDEVDVTELERLRAELNAGKPSAAARPKLTLLPFLVLAIVRAARDFPDLNARFDDEAGVLTRHRAVHVGIATQTDAGLLVPVLRDAQSRDLWGNAAEIVRLAEAARAGKAVRDELAGSTITITSLGRTGGLATTPVINHPEVAIVGPNRIDERVVVREGRMVVRQMMNLSCSFDHRVVDGATAAAFVQRLKRELEMPALLFAPV